MIRGRIERSEVAKQAYDIRNTLNKPSKTKEKMRIMSKKKDERFNGK